MLSIAIMEIDGFWAENSKYIIVSLWLISQLGVVETKFLAWVWAGNSWDDLNKGGTNLMKFCQGQNSFWNHSQVLM